MKKIIIAAIFIFSFIFTSCSFIFFTKKDNRPYEICPEEIRQKAYEYAVEYKALDTEYEWGGQDPLPRTIKLDCSGLVVRCYQYALEDTEYELPFYDASSTAMYTDYSYKIDNPKQGDLIFLGELETEKVTHIGIFDRIENGKYYFIDCSNLPDINKVSERCYSYNPKESLDNQKIKGFGIMYVVRK